MTSKINLSIPKELKEKLEQRTKETNFESINDYIVFILEQIISTKTDGGNEKVYTAEEEKDIRGDQAWSGEEKAYTDSEEESLKKNLHDLGYL